MSEIRYPEPVLCYVDGSWAYFTTRDLNHQWGDDWNDSPYEHNAGTPYEFRPQPGGLKIEPWEIVKVAYEGPFDTPRENHFNSPWSVEAINGGAVPWLRSSGWGSEVTVAICAGTPLTEFKRLIRQSGGQVYVLEAPT